MKALDKLFHTQSQINLEPFRCLIGVLTVFWGIEFLSQSSFWFGNNSLHHASTVEKISRSYGNLFFMTSSTAWGIPEVVYSILLVFTVLAGICLILGYRCRLASIVAFLCMHLVQTRVVFLLGGGDVLLKTFHLFLIFAPANQYWVLPQHPFSRLNFSPIKSFPGASRLIQTQIILIYMGAALLKIKNIHWQEGLVVSNISSFQWTVLGVEFFLGTLLLYRPLRVYMVALGVIFHGVMLGRQDIPYWHQAMMAGLLLFLPGGFWRGFLKYLQKITYKK